METKDIISWLYALKGSYRGHVKGNEPAAMIEKMGEAVDETIKRLKLLEQIKKELRGECAACENRETGGHCPACQECIEAHCGINWAFRWPLDGKEATDETD